MRMRTIKFTVLGLGITVAASLAVHAQGRNTVLQAYQQDAKAQRLSRPLIPDVLADIELTSDNYAIWRDHIQPDLSELAWEEIPWQTTFKDGIIAADTADKPLLLWTMNGHPLGCT